MCNLDTLMNDPEIIERAQKYELYTSLHNIHKQITNNYQYTNVVKPQTFSQYTNVVKPQTFEQYTYVVKPQTFNQYTNVVKPQTFEQYTYVVKN